MKVNVFKQAIFYCICAVSSYATVSNYAMASDGDISFSGDVINPTCEVISIMPETPDNYKSFIVTVKNCDQNIEATTYNHENLPYQIQDISPDNDVSGNKVYLVQYK